MILELVILSATRARVRYKVSNFFSCFLSFLFLSIHRDIKP